MKNYIGDGCEKELPWPKAWVDSEKQVESEPQRGIFFGRGGGFNHVFYSAPLQKGTHTVTGAHSQGLSQVGGSGGGGVT